MSTTTRCQHCNGQMELLGSKVAPHETKIAETYICFTCLRRSTVLVPNPRYTVPMQPARPVRYKLTERIDEREGNVV